MNDPHKSDELDELKRNPATLRLYTSRLTLQRRGNELLAKCPFHGENTPSFTVSQKDGVWLYKCFGCSRGGNVIQFVSEFDKIPLKSAIAKIKEFVSSSWESQKDTVDQTFHPPVKAESTKVLKTYSLEEYTAFERKLAANPAAAEWLWRERRITYDTAKQLHLGYRQAIKSNDDSLQDILDRGWIVFPSIEGGRVVSIKYRSIVRKAFSRQYGMATVLFNTETIDPIDTLYVVEGEFDAAALEQAGFRAISLPSASIKTLTPEMKDQIMRADRIILAGDNDNGVGAEKMKKLWAELQDTNRTYLLNWPTGIKDANQALLTAPGKEAKEIIVHFRNQVEGLTNQALSMPMPGVYSLAEAMLTSGRTNLSDHPNRLRFPWPSVDKMAILLPGSVLSLFATNTKMGKTCFVMNFTVDDAIKYNEVVLNYQCELSTDEMSNLVASYLLKRNRNHLGRADYQAASEYLSSRNVRYYVGRNPALNTVGPVLDLIEAGIKRLGATIVVLDHIHFICRNERDEVQAQANAMQRIKNMSVRYGTKFIVLGQPRKATQQNKGKVVHISDAKGSETFTSDADVLFAIHRDYIKIKDPNNPPKDDYDPKTEIHLLGARAKGDGAAFAVLQFHGDLAAFREEVPDPPSAAQQFFAKQ